VLSLERAWQLAQAWYHDRLSPSWKRKPLDETQQLLTRLGLTGPFWQLAGQ
jgi:hypothetical protein